MNTTIWKVSGSSPAGEAAGRALRDAGIGLLEKTDWADIAAALRRGEASLVVADAEAMSDLAARCGSAQPGVSPELARELSHELRTPLSAMAGWLHVMESSTLDAEGLKRAIAKLQSSLEQQVQIIEKYLGGNSQEERH